MEIAKGQTSICHSVFNLKRRQGMKQIVLSFVAVTVLCCTSAFAELKSCDELKAEIDATLQAKGVKEYRLEVVPKDQAKDQKIVGSCEGGTKKITYSREKGK
jgi:hypothetical protein